ncbi:HEAT repeat domain-containing protein [Algoriphagus sp. AGSA1]|uniref:HEAT repeat domain-containing protein n=1 Tax=Algoriphagus sp. AGSA1 TaxID=2907213 RepID=UPI001F44CDB5|nr:HEAT repeat domain-containing protein [Algoriphagus sp. AGSA1]MCE7056027.1 HEAT repeat domain-containing protein [Algoriphagus sp. AGSA1]
MSYKNAATLVFLFFLLVTAKVYCQQEVVFTDSVSFAEFLTNQGEIPGLQFGLSDPGMENSSGNAGENTSSYAFFTDFSAVLGSMDSLLLSGNKHPEVEFFIYNEPATFEATLEYVSILIGNGDLQLKTENGSTRKDLISLASKEHYSPMFNGLRAYFSDFKIFVVSVAILLFLVVASGMIVFMIIYKTRRNRKEALLAIYDEQVVNPLTEILFTKSLEELESISEEELNDSFPAKLRKKSIYNQVLIERIIALNKKMKGDFKLKLKALYKRLALDKVTLNKLNSKQWDTVVTGLVEINEMDLNDALREVKKHVNSPNFYIRSQAVATILNLSNSVDLSFLRDQTFPLSRWQQMNYLRIIKYLQSTRNLQINTLFDSANKSIRLFGYKLVRVLGLVELLAELDEKFGSVSDEEKIEILKTFEYLGVPAQNELVNSSLKSENNQLVIAAAKAAGSIGDESSVEIISGLLVKEVGFRLKMTLLKSLHSLDAIRYNQYIQEQDSSETYRINQHISDSLLLDV